MKDRLKQFAGAMERWEAMKATGLANDPVAFDEWAWSCSPLANGRHAARFQARLDNKLTARWVGQHIASDAQPSMPTVEQVKN